MQVPTFFLFCMIYSPLQHVLSSHLFIFQNIFPHLSSPHCALLYPIIPSISRPFTRYPPLHLHPWYPLIFHPFYMPKSSKYFLFLFYLKAKSSFNLFLIFSLLFYLILLHYYSAPLKLHFTLMYFSLIECSSPMTLPRTLELVHSMPYTDIIFLLFWGQVLSY